MGRETKILRYSNLDEHGDLGELLPNAADACVVLYEDKPDKGHWTGLLKYGGLFEHFDSYGNRVDAPLHWINMRQRRLLGEVESSLTRLPKQEDRYIYNNADYQSKDNSINTCGSHACHRVFRLKHDRMSLPDNHQLVKDTTERTGVGYDMMVAEWVRKFVG